MNTDDLDDHPDLRNLRLSKRAERKARAEARRRQRQAFGMPPEPSFLRRHRTTVVSLAVMAALVVVGALVVDRVRPGATQTGSPSTATAVTDPQPGVDLSQPFVGTPAAGWADGEGGIVPPAAAPVGSYTAEQVAAGYERVRQVLITSRLDMAVLEGHDNERYLALLAPGARAEVTKDLPPSEKAYQCVTRVADGFHLLPVPPKVSGSMWAEVAPDGALLVKTNYVFAYAFVPTDPDEIFSPMDIVAVGRFDTDYAIIDDRWAEADRGVWPSKLASYGYSIACEAYKRGELAPTYSERHLAEGEELPDEAQVFDPKSPMPTTTNCPD